jgi:hypothetical protein
MRSRVFPLAIISLLTSICFVALKTPHSTQAALASASQQPQDHMRKEVPEACQVTKPLAHPFVPPSPYPNQVGPDDFWFGNEKLWTVLPTDGTWRGLPHYRPTDTAFRQKLLWWRRGWRIENPPKLRVTGRRLDSPAAPLEAEASNGWTDDANHPFIIVGMDIPTLGCWKVTGRYEDAELSFVIRVTQ